MTIKMQKKLQMMFLNNKINIEPPAIIQLKLDDIHGGDRRLYTKTEG